MRGELTSLAFLVAHLFEDSVSTLTAELCAPQGFVYNYEYAIGLRLGFGPPLQINVRTFTPRDKRLLNSYLTYEGDAELYVQESLPLILKLFSIESQAKELDMWLDGVIHSETMLSEYLAFMITRLYDSYISQGLIAMISWYVASKNKVRFPHVVLLSTSVPI